MEFTNFCVRMKIGSNYMDNLPKINLIKNEYSFNSWKIEVCESTYSIASYIILIWINVYLLMIHLRSIGHCAFAKWITPSLENSHPPSILMYLHAESTSKTGRSALINNLAPLLPIRLLPSYLKNYSNVITLVVWLMEFKLFYIFLQ